MLRPRAFVAAACGSAAALAAAAPVAFASPTVVTDHGCYVVGQSALLSGAGFVPSTQLAVTVDGVLFTPNPSTDSNGTFSIHLHPGGLPAGVAQHTDRVMVDDGSGDMASTAFTLTRSPLAQLTATRKTSRGVTGRFKVWGFARDGNPRTVYVHYVGPRGHPHRTVALGSTGGPCGTLVSKRELFLPFSLSRGTWTLQVDTSPSYARHPAGPASRIRVAIG